MKNIFKTIDYFSCFVALLKILQKKIQLVFTKITKKILHIYIYIYIISLLNFFFFYHFNYPIFLTNKGSLIEIFCFVE